MNLYPLLSTFRVIQFFVKKVFLSQQNEQNSLRANFPVLQFVQAKLVERNGLLDISTQTLTKTKF